MKSMPNRPSGFTLVELLVVLTIIGVLATLITDGFINSQIRGRDSQRKSDLKQVANALELYYNDYGKYPDASSGQIVACPYNTSGSTACIWGQSEVRDTDTSGNIKTTYMKKLSKDPSSSQYYFYRIVTGSNNKKFQLFARLENTQDGSCISGNCTNPTVPSGVVCGTGINCNFSITSANTTPSE